MTHRLRALAGSLKASALVGAAVSAATLVYLIDRVGWPLGLVLGWVPALLMGLAASCLHMSVALIVQLRWREQERLKSAEASEPIASSLAATLP